MIGHKYNYKNNKSRKIILTLSPDYTKLVYHDAKDINNWGMFQSSTSVKLSKFSDLSYGGKSENFKKHRRLMRRDVELRATQNPNDAATESNKTSCMYEQDDIWYPWKCVSLVRKDGTTLDLTIGDDCNMLAFIHSIFRLVCKPPLESNFLREFKLNKIKMKLNFEAKASQMHLRHML